MSYVTNASEIYVKRDFVAEYRNDPALYGFFCRDFPINFQFTAGQIFSKGKFQKVDDS